MKGDLFLGCVGCVCMHGCALRQVVCILAEKCGKGE